MKLLFSRRHHPGSWLIRAVTWSEWSHVDIMLPDGGLIGAAAPHGVIGITSEERIARASCAAVMKVPCSTPFSWMLSQIDKPYDWLGVAGIGLHRDWEEDDKWFCSEFAARAMKEGGIEPFQAKAMRRVTPQHLWMLNYPTQIIK